MVDRLARSRILFFLLVIIILFICLFPFIMMLSVSLKPEGVATLYPPTIIPRNITFEHYLGVLDPEIFPFIRYFINSMIVSLCAAGFAVLIATLGAYSFARLRYPGRELIQRSVLLVYMFGGILLVIPFFQMVIGFRRISGINLIDTRMILIITYLVFTLPVSLYMLGNYFRSIPQEIEEAAIMDGYSRLEVIWKIVLPLSAPAIVAVFIYAFMIAWNEYLFALVFLNSPEKFTLPRGLSELFHTRHYIWGRIMSASLLTAVPVIILFLYLEKFMVQGLTFGAVKE